MTISGLISERHFDKLSFVAKLLNTADDNRFKQILACLRSEDFSLRGTSGSHQGISILWLLANYAVDDGEEGFLAIWEKFGHLITIDDLRVQAQKGVDKGKTVLWFLAEATRLDSPKPFAVVWEKLGHLVTREDLLVKAQKYESKGKSVLWQLAGGEDQTNFLSVWQKLGKFLTVEDFCETNYEEGISPLWLLAQRLVNGSPASFMAVWTSMCQLIPLEILCEVKPEDKKSIFEMLISSSDVVSPTILRTILAQKYGIIDLSTLHPNGYKSLISARNELFVSLSVSQDSMVELNRKAYQALNQGYLNAFYDVGQYCEKNGWLNEACMAYVLVPKESWYYMAANAKLAPYWYGKALTLPDRRAAYLQKALDAALQSPDDIRSIYLQKIAFSYITDNTELGFETDILPTDLIEAMHGETPVEWCLKRFDELKEKRARDKREQQLEKENAELKQKLSALEEEHQHLVDAYHDLQRSKISEGENLIDSLKELLSANGREPNNPTTNNNVPSQTDKTLQFIHSSRKHDRDNTREDDKENKRVKISLTAASKRMM